MRQTRINIHDIYDNVAEKWARDEPKLRDDLISWPLIKRLAREFGTGGVILDCGCGDGNLCRAVRSFARRVIGIDISPRMLVEARKKSHGFNNISYIKSDILNIGLDPEIIDLCLAIFAVCCMKNRKELARAFQQIYTVLKPGGFAIIQIPHPLENFLRESSTWAKDTKQQKDYFIGGQLIRRKLQTVDEDWLLVARYHFPMCDYFDSITSGGFTIKNIFEPKPPPEVIDKYPELSHETRFPSSLIFLVQKVRS